MQVGYPTFFIFTFPNSSSLPSRLARLQLPESASQLLLVPLVDRLPVSSIVAVLAVAWVRLLLDRRDRIAGDQPIGQAYGLAGQVLEQNLVLPHRIAQAVQLLFLNVLQLADSFVTLVAPFDGRKRLLLRGISYVQQLSRVIEHLLLPRFSLFEVQPLDPCISLLEHVALIGLVHLEEPAGILLHFLL